MESPVQPVQTKAIATNGAHNDITRVTKLLQNSVRKQVFSHVMRLPLHRIQELKSGGAASILRQDASSVGDLVFGMLYNPWRAIIQLVGSLIILAWVDWRLLLGALVAIPLVFATHRTWIARIRPQHRRIRAERGDFGPGAPADVVAAREQDLREGGTREYRVRLA